MKPIDHPVPYASWESRGFWEGAGRSELVLQRWNAEVVVEGQQHGWADGDERSHDGLGHHGVFVFAAKMDG